MSVARIRVKVATFSLIKGHTMMVNDFKFCEILPIIYSET